MLLNYTNCEHWRIKMIKISKGKKLYVPLIVCDICGKPIENMGMGTAIFRNDLTEGQSCDVLHAHKGNCHDLAEAKIGCHLSGWVELKDHLIQLLHNADQTLTKLEQQRETRGFSNQLKSKPSKSSSKKTKQKQINDLRQELKTVLDCGNKTLWEPGGIGWRGLSETAEQRVRDIGVELDRLGGFSVMQDVYGSLPEGCWGYINGAWDGIGTWLA